MGGWWWVVVELDYSVSSGPFLSSELIIGPGPGPGPELDNSFMIFGLDFPLGVQTLLLACSVMMMMESNYAVHVL